MKEQTEQQVETIKMVERALTVLDLLRTSKERLGVNEIAKRCELSPSTAFRILKTLEVSGWVFQLSDDRYIPGQKMSFVTEKNNLYVALSDVAGFVMKEYTAKYNQAMNLMVREGVHCNIIQQSRTGRLVEYIPPLFSSLPFYACAGGKVLLSELPVSLVEQIISSCEMVPLTSHTITSPEQFFAMSPPGATPLTTGSPPKTAAASPCRYGTTREPSSRPCPSAGLWACRIRTSCWNTSPPCRRPPRRFPRACIAAGTGKQ